MSPVRRGETLANRPHAQITGKPLLNSLRGTEQSIWYVHSHVLWNYRCRGLRPFFFDFAILLLLLAFAPLAFAQSSPGPSRPMIAQPINETDLVVLWGNTRPEAENPANDRGMVPDNLSLPHLMLQLRRPAAQEQALETLIDQLHDRNSPNYHHWLTAAEIGARFGPAAYDVEIITGWLQQHGFTVNTVYTNGMVIDFSGTAGQVRAAFHTEVHNLLVNGVAHIANMTDPQIPAALAPAGVGIVQLHNFMPRATSSPHPSVSPSSAVPQFTTGGSYYVAPPDLEKI